MLQCVAVCCSVLQCVAAHHELISRLAISCVFLGQTKIEGDREREREGERMTGNKRGENNQGEDWGESRGEERGKE